MRQQIKHSQSVPVNHVNVISSDRQKPTSAHQIVNTEEDKPTDDEFNEVESMCRLSFIILTIMSGSINYGYSLSYLTLSYNTLFEIIQVKGSKTDELSLFGSMHTFGCLVGSIISYCLLRSTTRRQSILIADLLGITSILMIVAQREVILTFRFIYGVSIGISYIIQPIYIKEVCPEKYFAKFSIFIDFSIGIGQLIGTLMGIGYLNSDLRGPNSNWWRVVFAVPAGFCLIRQIILFIFPIESPVSLVLRRQNTAAREQLEVIYTAKCIDQQIEKCVDFIKTSDGMNLKQICITSSVRKRVVIGAFTQNWCGIMAVFAYTAQLMEGMAGNDLVMITIYTIILNFVQQCPIFISGYLYNNFGKRPLLLIGLLMIIILLVTISILSHIGNPTLILFVLICIVSFIYAALLSPIVMQMIPDINDDAGTFVGLLSNWVWLIALLYLYPYLIESLGMDGIFLLFAIITLLCTVYFYCTIKETKGYNRTQIMQQYETISLK